MFYRMLYLVFYSVELSSSQGTVFNLDYDIVLLSGDAQATKRALDQSVTEAPRYDMRFTPSKFKVFLQDWEKPVPAPFVAVG